MGSVVHWTAFLLLYLLLAVLSQKIPTRKKEKFFFKIPDDVIFYDTHAIPDGAEQTAHLIREQENRYFFTVEEDDSPFILTVSPCEGPIEWTLYREEKEEQNSADYSDDPVSAMADLAVETIIPKLSDPLKKYTGDRQITYSNPHSAAGLYHLVIKALKRDTRITLFASTSPTAYLAFPSLPVHSRVKVTAQHRRGVSLEWKHSPLVAGHGLKNIKYCLLINRARQFTSHCGAMGFIKGIPPPRPPKFAGFGPADRKRQKTIRRLYKTSKAAKPSEYMYECVGTKTSFFAGRLDPGQKYFVDVFAVNTDSNTSVRYNGTSFMTRSFNKTVVLKEDSLVSSSLQRSRTSRLFRLKTKKANRELLFYVQSCSAPVMVEIRRRNRLLVRRTVRHLRTITVQKAKAGLYTLRVSTRRPRNVSIRILATSQPFAGLPQDNRIKVHKNQTQCSSVTLAWKGTSEKLNYCLFKREIPAGENPKKYLLSNTCVSSSDRKKTEKVLCRNFKYKNPRRPVTKEIVRGLQPNMTYIFDVYVQQKGFSLAYQSAEVKTGEC